MIQFTQADVDRFMSFVEKLPNGCWFWTGARSRGKGNKKWYGSFKLGKNSIRAHRFSCEALANPPKECPPEHHRDHTCRFSLCVNFDHVEIVHKDENQRRKVERRRSDVMTDTDKAILTMAVARDGNLGFADVYGGLGIDPDSAWRHLDRLRNLGALVHVRYNLWTITDSGRVAAAIGTAKEKA